MSGLVVGFFLLIVIGAILIVVVLVTRRKNRWLLQYGVESHDCKQSIIIHLYVLSNVDHIDLGFINANKV